MYYAAMGILVVSGVLYQLCQKLIPPAANPAASLIVSYLAALALSLGLLAVFPPKGGVSATLGQLNAASLLLAFPIIGIELGYLLLYRNGGRLSYSSAIVSSIVTAILVLVGLGAFKERIDAKKVLGILLCASGVALLNLK
jgi:drug/metabolite transporter (DMT)-like permease